jgi:ubiquitin C-terminal hydrolase
MSGGKEQEEQGGLSEEQLSAPQRRRLSSAVEEAAGVCVPFHSLARAGASAPALPVRALAAGELSVRGLHNLGNSCYLNALLQALAACSGLVEFVREAAELHAGLLDAGGAARGAGAAGSAAATRVAAVHELAVALDALAVERVPEPRPALSVARLRSLMRELSPVFRRAHADAQQDADELLYAVLETVELVARQGARRVGREGIVAIMTARAPPPPPPRAGLARLLAEHRASWATTTTADSRTIVSPGAASPGAAGGLEPVPGGALALRMGLSIGASLAPGRAPNPAQGTVMSQMACRSCGAVSELRGQPLRVLSLPLLTEQGQLLRSLPAALRAWVAHEVVEGVQCRSAQCGGAKRSMLRRQSLGRVPRAALVVHLSRRHFDARSGRGVKLAHHVAFPERLDLAPYTFTRCPLAPAAAAPRPRGERPAWELRAVLQHQGGAEGGHFIAWRRLADQASVDDTTTDGPLSTVAAAAATTNAAAWVCASDADVRYVTAQQALASQAYLLFYARRPCRAGAPARA